jgi:hypothetical protein
MKTNTVIILAISSMMNENQHSIVLEPMKYHSRFNTKKQVRRRRIFLPLSTRAEKLLEKLSMIAMISNLKQKWQ